MADTFLLEIATPERSLLKEQVTEAQIPGMDGYFGILPDHAPMLTRLKPGLLTYMLNGKEETLAVHGGFAEVKDNHMRCVVDQAERAEEIDLERAQEAHKAALAALNDQSLDIDLADALASAMSAEARIEAAQKHRNNNSH